MITRFPAARRPLATLAALVVSVLGLALVAAPAAAGGRRHVAPAYEVELYRTGGFAGLQEHLTVPADSAHSSAASLFRTVASPEFRNLAPAYSVVDTCCDRFSYTLLVHHRDGGLQAVQTVDGADAPAILWEAITLTSDISSATS